MSSTSTLDKNNIEVMITKEIHNLKKEIDKKITDLENYTKKDYSKLEEYFNKQEEKLNKFSEKIENKFNSILETVNKKSEMDLALLTQIQELSKRVDKVEVAKVSYDKYIAELNVKVDHLITMMTRHSLDKMNEDIGNAHEKIRDHENRLRPLELQRGKQALRILWYLGTLVLGGAFGVLVSHISWLLRK